MTDCEWCPMEIPEGMEIYVRLGRNVAAETICQDCFSALTNFIAKRRDQAVTGDDRA